MKNKAVINAIGMSEYAFRPVGGQSAWERVLEYARNLPGIGGISVLTDGDVPLPADAVPVRKARWTVPELIASMAEIIGAEGDLFYVYGDLPFLDGALAERMYRNHTAYFADYSFADGYPYGISPEIVSARAMPLLGRLAGDREEPVRRDTLFTVIQKDINAFDIETEISPRDLRLLRASLSCDTRRNFLLVERLADAGVRGETDILRTLEERPEILRTLPAYFNIQIIDGCPQACSYCPFPGFGGDILRQRGGMSAANFRLILDRIEAFCDDATVSVSLWGEPALHPEIETIVESCADRPGIDLIVETSGVGWKEGTLRRLAEAGRGNTSWIVSLDADDRALYRRLRGSGADEAQAAARLLLEIVPDRTWIQAVRMLENEEHLESFYKEWKTRTPNIIIQKYDDFCGLLQQRKVTDLSPLNRFPCRHIQRDVSILSDGTVPLCREDVAGKHVLGNVLQESLEDIWRRGEPFYRQHIREDYPDLCRGCDEYYTFNF